ncbi:MAG: hypothetical protein QNK37_24925 [Acidobacteriota bacterium]|nr:hypothetical protein [Acidobacteriota bacterium]
MPASSKQFFPLGDRNQLLLSLELPEGTHLETTDRAVKPMEEAMSNRSEVASVAAFIGRSSPQF